MPLTNQAGLVGHGAWADGSLGSSTRSSVLLNDYLRIRDSLLLDQEERFRKLNALGDEAAAFVDGLLLSAADHFRALFLLTHVPPFREAAWHEGETSADDWLPHFSCKAVGDVLVRVMTAHPSCSLTVLCGHTHGEGEVRVLDNLLVRTAGARPGLFSDADASVRGWHGPHGKAPAAPRVDQAWENLRRGFSQETWEGKQSSTYS